MYWIVARLVPLLGLLLVASCARAGRLIEGSDPKAEPFKQAVATLAKRLASGELEKAQAAYAGEGIDLELLKAYVDGVKAATAMRAAVDVKFGADPERLLPALDTIVAEMRVHDLNTVILDQRDPDAASTSADSPMGVGIELKRVKGEWKVRSLASAPNEHIFRLKGYIRSIQDITTKVKSGAYQDFRDVSNAAQEANSQLWPLTHATPSNR